MTPRQITLLMAGLLLAVPATAREPIIDMHVHAAAADEQGPPPLAMCNPMNPMPTWDQTLSWPEALIGYFKHPTCKDPIWSPTSDDEIMRKSLAIMEKRNIIAVLNDRGKRVEAWRKLAPERVLPGINPDDDEMSDAKAIETDFGAQEGGQGCRHRRDRYAIYGHQP